ncbi:hypothetical protein [Ancylobacter sp. IITR112]|uniref:hypothetical protein n=1 Tax=Ancylobacter sp. IITR112 TaxID=3138073 RepID=UPI00352A5032
MAATERLYAGTHYVNYGQIGLWDKADLSAYPVPNGPLPWWGPKGVVVPARDDGDVAVCVAVEPTAIDDGYVLLTSGDMDVGDRGLTVGNVTTASMADVAVPQGRYGVKCYYRGKEPSTAMELFFALSVRGDTP